MTTIIVAWNNWHNIFVKCGGDRLVLNQYITKPKEKTWGTWHIISPLSEKVRGPVPCVRQLIVPLHGTELLQMSRSSKQDMRSKLVM